MNGQPTPLPANDTGERSRRLGRRLALGALAMFGFGYAMVPVYRVVCELTGFNGTTTRIGSGAAHAQPVDGQRLVTVEFLAATSSDLAWEFRPDVASVQVRPGQVVLATYRARNISGRPIVGQAVPSVTPHAAAPYFHKVECFCFTRQPLAPGESKSMPVQFVLDAALPADIATLTLSYTFFRLPTVSAQAAADDRDT
ncbi:MAG: cytochrome c oxidase assembly protein [Rhodocyclales bacterium]|nr:cytochrome c oxidase assembly protein [Rhodocyclales bacterium]